MATLQNKNIEAMGTVDIVFHLLQRHQVLLWSTLATAEATYILVKGIF